MGLSGGVHLSRLGDESSASSDEPETSGAVPTLPPSLCVINHNGFRYLERSLGAVEPLRGSFHEVLLIDDVSTDDSVELVRRRFPWVKVVLLEENRGPAAARNAALRAAAGDRVLLIDNDVYVPPDCVQRMQEALLRNPRAAVIMGRCVYASRPDVIQFDAADAHFIGLQIVEPRDQPIAEGAREARPIGSLITSCFLVDRRRLGREVEFDEAFFIYLEDHDFGLRVRGRGHDIVSVPDVVCLHGEGTEDLSIRRTGGYSKRRVFYLIRNRWLLVSKNYRWRTLLVLSPVFAVYELAQLAGVLKKGWLAEWLKAAGWMLTHVGYVRSQRRQVLGARVLPDRELLRGGPLPFRDELAAGRLERLGQDALNALASAYWSLAGRWI